MYTCTREPVQGDDLSFHNKWFHGLPTVPSHYCRSGAFAKDKKYLNPGTTILQFYKEDSTTAQESHVRVVGRKFLTELFQKLNFSYFFHERTNVTYVLEKNMVMYRNKNMIYKSN